MTKRSLLARTATAGMITGGLGLGAVLAAAARARPLSPEAGAPVPPALPPGRAVPVPGRGEMFVREVMGPRDADAPTIVLVHGWMFPSDLNWFTCYDALGEVGRVIAADHRGHGRGARPATPFRLTDVADDLAALLRHLGSGPVVAVGYSMGGPIVQLLWRRHPDLVRGMVLCATSASFSVRPRDRWVWRTMGALQLALRLLPRAGWERAIRLQLEGRLPVPISRMVNPDTPEELRVLLPWMLGELHRGSAEDIAEAGRELGRYDGREWLGEVDVPTAVLMTARDKLVPRQNQRDLAARIPGAALYELPLDHDGVGARPDLFVPTLRKAIEEILDAGQR